MILLTDALDDKIERLEQALNEKDNNIEELNAKIEQLKNLLDVRKMSESPTEIYEPVPSGNTSYQVQSLQDEKSVLEHQLSDLQAYVKDRELQINHYRQELVEKNKRLSQWTKRFNELAEGISK